MTDFAYSPMFPTGTDSTEYELVTADHVEVVELGGERFLKVDPEGLRLLAQRLSRISRIFFAAVILPSLRRSSKTRKRHRTTGSLRWRC